MGKRARNGSVIALVAIGLTLSQVSTAAALPGLLLLLWLMGRAAPEAERAKGRD